MSTVELLNTMNWLSIDKLVTLNTAIMINNILNTKEPELLYLRLTNNSNTNNNSNRSSLGKKLGQKPINEGKSRYTVNQFVSISYKIYNNLPSQITSISDPQLFKKHLKTYLKTNMLPNHTNFPIYGLYPGL